MIAPVVLPGANQSIDVFQRDFIDSAKRFRHVEIRGYAPGELKCALKRA
jgi:hypothetical protein